MRWAILYILLATVVVTLAKMPVAEYRDLPTLREQDALEKGWVQKRYDFIPTVLEKYGYDAWIVTQREYGEDTVFRSLVRSTTMFSAHRRMLWMFHTNPDVPCPVFYWNNQPEIWTMLNESLHEVNPKKIAVNIDTDEPFSDGLHTGEGQVLMSNLDPHWASRVSSHRMIGVEVIAKRVGGKEQLDMYKIMMENIWAMIQEGFSEKVIEVGKTTSQDLVWWFRDVMRWRFGTGLWFHPTLDIYRHPSEPSVEVDPHMREGDMIHVDIGITAMGMNTDTQHLGYILRSNETSPPRSLLKGLHDANKMQDFTRHRMVPDTTGDEVLHAIRDDMKKADLKGLIYSHPIGDFGHSAGAVIGMTNLQETVPGRGQLPVLNDYWTSVELQGHMHVPEWGVDMRFELEEDVYWDEKIGTFEWVFGQQTEFHLVKPKKAKVAPSSMLSWLAAQLGWNVVQWA